ncbi:hypothetical protein KHA80_02300 [Anaerobacillus sp. HL2]|nr:hypothetical protein KHA80_02300 [Anaerobacillus sp. HL2]
MKVTIMARSCPSMRRRKDEGNDHGKVVPFDAKKRKDEGNDHGKNC